MGNLNFIEQINEVSNRIKVKEQLLGKGLMMPFNPANSGSRKLMFSTQVEHKINLTKPEIPITQTGYEYRFGQHTSSLVIADQNYIVLEKIVKFTNDHYYLLVLGEDGVYKILERTPYEHLTETYGFLYDNKYIDSLKQNSVIKEGETVKKSTSYDEFNNRLDGVNLLATYTSNEYSKEDSIILNETAARKLSAPLLKTVQVIINDNDIPLNLYGDNDVYKSFPDIGEDIKDGILCALRREKIEECLFAQSSNRLKNLMMSDEKIILEGKVIDINIYCNKPEILNEYHFSQLKYYYNRHQDFVEDFVNKVGPIIESGKKCDYELQKLYYYCKKSLNGSQFIKDKLFSNTVIEFIVQEDRPAAKGDKISNRYGGKGVISLIIPDDQSPILDNGEVVEIQWNSSTCFNRENIGQLFEMEINHIGSRIIEYMNTRVLDFDQALEMYIKFISIISQDQGKEFKETLDKLDIDEKMRFIELVCQDKGIIISTRPMSDSMSIDKLRLLYKEFPFAVPHKMKVVQEDSNGNLRYIDARRPMICGRQYVYRLKQYAEEKFSAVSLSATNIKNENSRNSSKKNYKSAYSRTPIRFGEMETGDLLHLGVENVIINLMIHSSSPKGRRLAKKLLTDDPFNPNIVLDDESENRSVQILNAYLLTMGLELEFKKIPKNIVYPILRQVIQRPTTKEIKNVIYRINKNENFDTDKYLAETNNYFKPIITVFPIKRCKKGDKQNEQS